MNLERNIIRKSIAAAFIAVFVGMVGVSTSNAQGVLKEILDRMDGNYKTLSTFRSSVKMDKFNEQIGSHDVKEGTTAFISKNFSKKQMYVRIEWTKPLEESVVVIGEQYKLYRPKLGQAIVGSTKGAKNSGAAGGALAFMSMSKAELQKNYLVQYIGQEGITGAVQTWHILMTPKKAANYKTADLWVDSDGMPRQAKITELNNDTTTVVLTEIKKNADVKANEFSLDVPKGTKIVKG